MSIIVSNIMTPVSASQEEIIGAAMRAVGVKRGQAIEAGVYKSSLDARKRTDIKLVSSVYLRLASEADEKRISESDPSVRYFEESTISPDISGVKRDGRVVITGFGPAGMFCALILAEYGYKPIVLERGADVETRAKAVEGFWNGWELDTETNVQFGEGGAGTFSDGKLTTRIGDPLCRYVLKRFCEFGAPKEIMYEAKPHIGTDKLRQTVKALRERVISLGGEIRLGNRLDDIDIASGRVKSIMSAGNEIKPAALVIAIGHSARDTFKMLLNRGVTMEAKPFSVGARIEHRQIDVDRSLYGVDSRELKLPKGEYQLSYRRKEDGRAVYTFCMCPGGSVVASASERKSVVTNGMSEYARDGENANAALVASVSPDDFGHGVLAGVDFASDIERRAYKLSGSDLAPASSVGKFLDGGRDHSTICPTYRPGVVYRDLGGLFPDFVSNIMREGIRRFSRQMKCFGDRSALLTAPETRTSSPVRILRGENLTALGIENLYPCGEGAGYAGGIMSAAVDGIRVALKIMEAMAPPDI